MKLTHLLSLSGNESNTPPPPPIFPIFPGAPENCGSVLVWDSVFPQYKAKYDEMRKQQLPYK